MKRILKLFVLLPMILLSLIIALFFISPILNNISLYRFSNQLNKYHLPQETEIVEKKKICGKLNGNGNGMDYFACILLKSDLSINDIKQYYSKASFNPAKIYSKNTVIAEVTQLKGEKLESEYVENQDVYFDLKAGEDYSKYYVLMIYDGGYPAGFDIRGN